MLKLKRRPWQSFGHAISFTTFIIGKHFEIETDHKPLVPLLSSKHLDTLPPRILRFRLRLGRYDYSIQHVHVAGKFLFTADALSRAPCSSTAEPETGITDADVESFADTITSSVLVTKTLLEKYRMGQFKDPTCTTIKQFCLSGWPEKRKVPANLKAYWLVRHELSICKDLLLFGCRIVVPDSLKTLTLQRLHDGHLGIQQCCLRAASAVWWPGLAKQVINMVQRCLVCANITPYQWNLYMISSCLPAYPWQRVSTDLFVLKGCTYLLVVDYFSRYPEVIQLATTTSKKVIGALKSVFARHGIPEEVVSDNGPQFALDEMKEFAQHYGFHYCTSSPYYPQGNGHAERAVKTVKNLLSNTEDPWLELLNYRAAPFPWCGLSPAELHFGRRIRTRVPQVETQLTPGWPYLDDFCTYDQRLKQQQKTNYDLRHRVRSLSPLKPDTEVWIKQGDKQTKGTVVTAAATPRSYIVATPEGPKQTRNQTSLTMIISLKSAQKCT